VADQQTLAEASPRQWHMGGHARAAFEHRLGKAAYLKPFAEVHVVRVRSRGYTERGPSPFNLAVEGQGEVAAAVSAGLELGGRIGLGGRMMLRPFTSAAIEALDNDWDTTARFANLPSSSSLFSATTPAPGTRAKFAVGADILGDDRLEFRFQYAPEVGDGFVSHVGVARLAYRF
jgi:outer membrane autotransporter protein